ncbi:MAG: drug resistance transporter [Actinomycetia bacterium]|nr:drug resistance transporter [Actinomycetes bacterium]
MVTKGGSEVDDRQRWVVLASLCVCLVVIGVDNTILNVALPSIVRSLDASGSQLQWMVAAYTIVFACLLLTAGALGDRYGRRRALLIGVGWFGVFSGLASLAQSPGQLIAARACMGVGGAFIFPTTLSVLSNVFTDPRERSRAIGIWAGVSGIGIAAGPLLGGILVEHLGWHSVFWINVPICAGAFLLCRAVVPESGSRDASPLDPFGAVLSITGLVSLLYGIIEAPNHGWSDLGVAGPFLAGIALLAAFGWWETANPAPMLDVRLFRNPRFTAASATITLVTFVLFASTFLLTEYFQFILGYSPLKAGAMITPIALGLMVGSPQAPRFVARYGTKRVVVGGLAIICAGMVCYTSDTIMSSFGLGFLVRMIFGFGVGTTSAPVTESIMGSLPPERAGVGSAVNDTTRQMGGALGVAVLGSVFAARYHAAINATSSVPGNLRHAARESIGATLQLAKANPVSAKVLEAAGHDAFLTSMRLTFGIGALIIVGAATVAWRYLPAQAVDMRQRLESEVDEALLAGAEASVS